MAKGYRGGMFGDSYCETGGTSKDARKSRCSGFGPLGFPTQSRLEADELGEHFGVRFAQHRLDPLPLAHQGQQRG